jgi:phosphate transport system substrate-binding protein
MKEQRANVFWRMKYMNSKIARVVVTVSAALSLAAAALVPTTAIAQAIRIDGSSTVYPITEAVAEEFQKVKKASVKVTVGISGTGGGFKKFCRGETDISDASRPILKAEMEICKAAGIEYIELPIAYDALTVVVNKDNDFIKSLTVEEMKKMWEPAAQGKVTKWKQVNPAWPDEPLKLFGAGSDSGTFDYFTEAVVGKAKSSRGDYTASEDDNVLVQGVSRDKFALGYFGFSYYIENQQKLKAVPIVAKAGASAVEPSPKSVEDGTYQPLSRPIFIYVKAKALERPEVKEFVEFYLKNAAALTKEVKYIPLPQQAYALAAEHVAKRKLGTVFGGTAEVGVKIEDLLKREGKL